MCVILVVTQWWIPDHTCFDFAEVWVRFILHSQCSFSCLTESIGGSFHCDFLFNSLKFSFLTPQFDFISKCQFATAFSTCFFFIHTNDAFIHIADFHQSCLLFSPNPRFNLFIGLYSLHYCWWTFEIPMWQFTCFDNFWIW